MIEALRRVAGRLVIFCQKGRITVPRTATLLYSYLEPVVVETALGAKGFFIQDLAAAIYRGRRPGGLPLSLFVPT